MFKVDKLYGYVESIPIIIPCARSVILGGICREYDKEGNLIKEKVTENMRVTYDRAKARTGVESV